MLVSLLVRFGWFLWLRRVSLYSCTIVVIVYLRMVVVEVLHDYRFLDVDCSSISLVGWAPGLATVSALAIFGGIRIFVSATTDTTSLLLLLISLMPQYRSLNQLRVIQVVFLLINWSIVHDVWVFLKFKHILATKSTHAVLLSALLANAMNYNWGSQTLVYSFWTANFYRLIILRFVLVLTCCVIKFIQNKLSH